MPLGPRSEVLELHAQYMWCTDHIKVFTAASKTLYNLATGMLLDKLMEDAEFYERCHGRMDNIKFHLRSVAPVCCYIPRTALQDIFRRTGRGSI